MQIPKVSVVLDTRRAKKDGTYPVKVRVFFKGKQKLYPTKLSLAEGDYERAMGPRPRGQHKELRAQLDALNAWAHDTVQSMKHFSFPAFEREMGDTADAESEDNLFTAFSRTVERLFKEERISTAESYRNAMRSIQGFVRRRVFEFERITPEWLQSYEDWMLSKGKSISTVGIYTRYVRALFNEAIEKGIVSGGAYPFGKRKYQIPNARNVKQALGEEEIAKIFAYEPEEGSNEHFARDLWLFSYLCNGANLTDIFGLRHSDISEGRITFVRKKTARSSKANMVPVVAVLTDDMQRIIDQWGNPPHPRSNYLFPIFRQGMDAARKRALVKQHNKSMNRYMRGIFKKMGIEKYISAKVARHSFSMALLNAGAPIEFIGGSLGHQNVQTTRFYTDDLRYDIKKNFAAKLTAFRDKKEGDK